MKKGLMKLIIFLCALEYLENWSMPNEKRSWMSRKLKYAESVHVFDWILRNEEKFNGI